MMDDSSSSESSASDRQSSSGSGSYLYDSDGSYQYSHVIGNVRYSKKAFKRILYSDDPNDKEKVISMIIDCIKENNSDPLESILCRIRFNADDVLIKEKGQTAIHLAYYYDVADLLENLILCYIRDNYVNSIDCYGLTHLHVGCWAGNEELIKKCLEGGADINACYSYTDSRGNTINGVTPLHLASMRSAKTVKFLLEKEADVNATNSLGRSALHVACCIYGYPFDGKDPEQTYEKVEVMKVLLDHGCDVNLRDKSGNTPLHRIYRESYFTATGMWPKVLPLAETLEKLKLLLERGADVAVSNDDGDTALHRLIRILQCVNYYEPEVRRQDFDPTMHGKMVEMILNRAETVDSNAKNSLGETPLQLAVSFMSAEIVKVLLDHSADLSNLTFNRNDEYCFSYAYDMPKLHQVHNVVRIMQILLNKGLKLSLEDNLMIIKFLIHDVKRCECENATISDNIEGPLADFFVDSYRNDSIETNLKNLMAFGSSNHFEYVFTEMIKSLQAKNLIDEKKTALYFVKQLHYYKHVAGIFIEKEILNVVKSIQVNYEICQKQLYRMKQEIACMKNIELEDGISLHDIMVKHPHDVYKYISHINFHDLHLRVRFYIYDQIIEGHLTKSLIRHYVEKSAYDYLAELSFVVLPEVCTRNVLYYLSNEEILNLCLAAVGGD